MSRARRGPSLQKPQITSARLTLPAKAEESGIRNICRSQTKLTRWINPAVSLVEFMAIGWKTLQQIIPYGRAEEVAEEMGVSLDTMHRWMRAPLSSENQNATGRVNPIDYLVRLIKAVDRVIPGGGDEIAAAIVSVVVELDSKRGSQMPAEIEALLRDRVRADAELANALDSWKREIEGAKKQNGREGAATTRRR